MDLEALRIFKAVVDEGGVNKAAARLHRVPSNVTTRVKQLEEQLGAKLFAREGRKLKLSAEGKVLLNYAEQLLRLSPEAETALRGGKPRGSRRSCRGTTCSIRRSASSWSRARPARSSASSTRRKSKRPSSPSPSM